MSPDVRYNWVGLRERFCTRKSRYTNKPLCLPSTDTPVGQGQPKIKEGLEVLLHVPKIYMRLNVDVNTREWPAARKLLTEPNRCRGEGRNPVIPVYRTHNSLGMNHCDVRRHTSGKSASGKLLKAKTGITKTGQVSQGSRLLL